MNIETAQRVRSNFLQFCQPFHVRLFRIICAFRGSNDGDIEIVENVGFLFFRADQIHLRKLVTLQFKDALFLRLVLAASFHRDLEERTSQQRVVLAGVDLQPRLAAAAMALIEFLNIPRRTRRTALHHIRSRLHRKGCDISRKLMLAMTVRWSSIKNRNNNEWPKMTYHTDRIA